MLSKLRPRSQSTIGCVYAATDKRTLIRNRCYLEFNDAIEAIYAILDESDANSGKKISLDTSGLEQYLLELFRTELKFTGITPDSDFFEAGVDSLQAIKARAMIKKRINIGAAELGHNVIFDLANIKRLAAHLCALRTGQG